MLRRFHPIVRKWFTETLGKPSDPQRKGWPAIATGEHALILAPTGTGKTLAAFLWELNALIIAGLTARVRFFERGTGKLWLEESADSDESLTARLGPESVQILDFIRHEGASFIGDIQAGTGLTMQSVRRGLRELASLGLVTNDTVEALREVVRWRALPTPDSVDPTRWLPADYAPSPNRRVGPATAESAATSEVETAGPSGWDGRCVEWPVVSGGASRY